MRRSSAVIWAISLSRPRSRIFRLSVTGTAEKPAGTFSQLKAVTVTLRSVTPVTTMVTVTGPTFSARVVPSGAVTL